jgi:hypothetical protein
VCCTMLPSMVKIIAHGELQTGDPIEALFVKRAHNPLFVTAVPSGRHALSFYYSFLRIPL